MYKVALIDDHDLMRSGLAAAIDRMGDYSVMLEAANGKEFIEELKKVDEEPAIAIVDLNMPVMDGYETIAWLKAKRPGILPLALTFDARDEAMVRAVREGARGFLLKNARPAVLRTALDSLMLSGYYHSDQVHEGMMRNPGMRTAEERERERIISDITPREMEFLKLVCSPQEHTYEQIADMMGIHRRTVDNFRVQLFDKFNIKSKTGLVLFAVKWNLIGKEG